MRNARASLEGMSETLLEAVENEEDVARKLVWDISAIGVYMMRIADLLGKKVGVSGSQWITMMTIHSLDSGAGVSVRDVAILLNVDGSFVSSQSKILEQLGIVRRAQSTEDRRLVLLSLTDVAKARFDEMESERRTLASHVRGELEDRSLQQLSEELISMRRRLGRAMLLVAAGD